MEAATLNCPMCGAPARSGAPNCGHCGSRLATVACPSCFGMIFMGSKFCAHCGTRTERSFADHTDLPCPRCKAPLANVNVGQTPVHECDACHGLWIEAAIFDRICTDREQQSAVLGMASETFRPGEKQFETRVRYVPCPVCSALMHRVNFAKCSGVIVDVCRGHGTWFDKHELQHIVEFIRTGGLELSRQKELSELEAARKRLEFSRSTMASDRTYGGGGTAGEWSVDETDLLSMAGSLIKVLLK